MPVLRGRLEEALLLYYEKMRIRKREKSTDVDILLTYQD